MGKAQKPGITAPRGSFPDLLLILRPEPELQPPALQVGDKASLLSWVAKGIPLLTSSWAQSLSKVYISDTPGAFCLGSSVGSHPQWPPSWALCLTGTATLKKATGQWHGVPAGGQPGLQGAGIVRVSHSLPAAVSPTL